MRVDLVGDALKMALAHRGSGQGLLRHGDQGVQDASKDYMHLLKSHHIQASMSGKRDCWDNAVMESFWATPKTELVGHERYATREQARASVIEYIEVFYNRQKLHSSLGYNIPETFEAGLN
jgi:putative transposase